MYIGTVWGYFWWTAASDRQILDKSSIHLPNKETCQYFDANSLLTRIRFFYLKMWFREVQKPGGFMYPWVWGNWAVGLGASVMQSKTIGHCGGGHSCKPNPYSTWLSNIKALKLVKAVAGLEKWFWWVHWTCKHDTREHRVPEVQPARRADFRWCACKSNFPISSWARSNANWLSS